MHHGVPELCTCGSLACPRAHQVRTPAMEVARADVEQGVTGCFNVLVLRFAAQDVLAAGFPAGFPLGTPRGRSCRSEGSGTDAGGHEEESAGSTGEVFVFTPRLPRTPRKEDGRAGC